MSKASLRSKKKFINIAYSLINSTNSKIKFVVLLKKFKFVWLIKLFFIISIEK
jgi:hypothetical protein